MTFVLGLAVSGPANADLMAIWDFGPDAVGYTLEVTWENVIDVPTLIARNADYDPDGKDGVAYTDAAGTLHDAGQAAAWDDVSGADSDAEWIMTIDTTGWKDMSIRWDYLSDATGGNQGPVSFDFDYKIGDGAWTEILNNEPIIRDDAWHEFSYDLSSLTAIEGQPSVQLRVSDLDRADENGDFKFDNLELTGVPESGCTAYPEMDFNRDCKVDFKDLAIFLQSWLECNRVPESACWE